jgi:hypothetical protein
LRRPAGIASTGLPVLLGAAWLLSLFAPLLSPGTVLANRDVPLFHLPLRAAFRWLAEEGLPVWNPWLNGGQPVLSNPSYAAFYPPSWLVLALPPAYALNLLVVLHAAIAFGGAWWLARRLGADRGGAALAAVGYTGSGTLLSLISALTLFCSMAWFPWFLGWTDAALRAEPGSSPGWRRPALLAGIALALQLLNGEPATVVVSGLGLLALATAGPRSLPRSLPRLLLPLTVAVLLAAVQLLPAWGRLAGSPRAGGLEARPATVWSAPPARIVELAFPRFFGDPTRDHEGLFFGWNLHDRDYPYVPAIYPGLLLTVLAVSALAQWPVPRRAAWGIAFAVGAFLALGRHNPLYELVRSAVPVLAVLRFPEKFAILAVAALIMAGSLGWAWLLRERQDGRPERADFPLAVALVLLATAGVLTGLLYRVPRVADWFVRAHGSPGLTPEKVRQGIVYLQAEGWAAIATAAAVAALLALCRWRRPPARLLTGIALALLAADLWHYGHGLVKVAPAALYQGPPPVRVPPETRLFVQEKTGSAPDFVPRRGDPSLAPLAPIQSLLDRMEPYSAVLWRIPYALNGDFDLMLTSWGSRALFILRQDWDRSSELALRYLGAWNAGRVLLRKDAPAWAAERNPDAPLMKELDNPYVLPRHRFVPRVVFHPDSKTALAAARAEKYALMQREHAVRSTSGEIAGEVVYRRMPEPLELEERGGRLRLRYRSESPAFFVLAETFDEGWQATLGKTDGESLAVYPTAVGQIGVELPAGEHILELRYRERLLPLGAAVTLATLALVLGALLLDRRSR